MIYHGVETRETVGVYRSFWALLDRDDPSRILRLEDEHAAARGEPGADRARSRTRCICRPPSSSPPASPTPATITSSRAARPISPAASPICPRRCSHDRALVADGRDLPDLSALVSGHATATASATSRGSSGGSTISPASASTRSGSRRSSPRRWPISATTSPTIAASIRASARSPISTICSRKPMRAGSRCCSTSCPTTPPTSIPGSSRAAPRATIRNATGTSGAIPRRTAGRPTTGSAISAARPGSGTRPPANITTTPS